MDILFSSLYGNEEGRNKCVKVKSVPINNEIKQNHLSKRKRVESKDSNSLYKEYFIQSFLTQPIVKDKTQLKHSQTCPSIESLRYRAVSAIARIFSDVIGVHLGSKWYKHYEAWLWSIRKLNSKKPEIIPIQQNIENNKH